MKTASLTHRPAAVLTGLAVLCLALALGGCLSEAERQRRLTDALYNGLQALDDDRLLHPPRYSAYNYFRRALSLERDNPIALQGMDDIVLRYAELARREIRRGLFEEAESLLERAEYVNRRPDVIDEVWLELVSTKRSDDLFFEIHPRPLRRRSDSLADRLHDIALQVRARDAFFLITAPSDADGQWIFLTMREAVEGYRLRGSVEIDRDRFGVRIRLPETESEEQ